MKDILPVFTVFISGIFGLCVTIVASTLSNRKDKRKYKLELYERNYRRTEERYVKLIAAINKTVRKIQIGDEHFSVIDEFNLISAECMLLDSKEFNVNIENVSDALIHWSYEYKLGSPKRIGDTSFVMISTQDTVHIEKAKELYSAFNKEMIELMNLIKENLANGKLFKVHNEYRFLAAKGYITKRDNY